MSQVRTGGCACGAVRFETRGALGDLGACHCQTCRRWSGHYGSAVDVPRSVFQLHAADTLAWWHASPDAARGFCRRCGASLFFDTRGASIIEVAAGAFDGSTGRALNAHMFCREAGDYYRIAVSVARYDGFPA